MLYSPPRLHHTRFDTFSLYDQLAAVPSQAFVATDCIKHLIQVVSYDICALKRNTQTAYLLIYKICDMYKEINDLIRRVDTEDGNTWGSYDRYTTAINPLEDFLLRVSDLAEKESHLWLTDHDSIDDCLYSIAEWAENRAKIRGFMTELRTRVPKFPPFSKDDVRLAQKHDDSNLLSILCHHIKTHPLQDVDTTM